MDKALADDLLLRLNEFRTDESAYCRLLAFFRKANEIGLVGRALDIGDIQRNGPDSEPAR